MLTYPISDPGAVTAVPTFCAFMYFCVHGGAAVNIPSFFSVIRTCPPRAGGRPERDETARGRGRVREASAAAAADTVNPITRRTLRPSPPRAGRRAIFPRGLYLSRRPVFHRMHTKKRS